MSRKPVLPKVETRSVTISLKATERLSKAIDQAAADNGRKKSAFVCDVMEIWLKGNGYLK
jgi:uncharacterized protein (DUF1778 family)